MEGQALHTFQRTATWSSQFRLRQRGRLAVPMLGEGLLWRAKPLKGFHVTRSPGARAARPQRYDAVHTGHGSYRELSPGSHELLCGGPGLGTLAQRMADARECPFSNE